LLLAMPPPPYSTIAACGARAFVLCALVFGASCSDERTEIVADSTGATHIITDGEAADQAARPKNVLLFVVDTLRADRLGAYGYERDTSPNIDAFASEATLWLDNRSQSNWTNPSMVSLMTGLWVTRDEQVLPQRFPALAELFQRNGFATGAFVANKTLTTGRGFQRGFDEFEFLNLPGGEVVASFTKWLDRRRASGDERGFFAWVHLIDPHTPYEPQPHFDVFEGPRPGRDELVRRWAREGVNVLGTDDPRSMEEFRAAARSMEELSNSYDGEVLQADAAFGRALEYLRRTGLLDDTLIVFAADHGELLHEYLEYPMEREARREGFAMKGRPFGLADHFAYGHRAWFYPELWNTPLIVRGPGFAHGERRSGLSANIDIFPTVLAATGISFAGERPGIDLARADLAQREHVFAHGFETNAVLEASGLQLVDSPPKRFLLPDSAPRVHELFDLSTGPELLPLQDERPSEAERLADVVKAWRGRAHRGDAVDRLDTSEAREALRELGYLEDD